MDVIAKLEADLDSTTARLATAVHARDTAQAALQSEASCHAQDAAASTELQQQVAALAGCNGDMQAELQANRKDRAWADASGEQGAAAWKVKAGAAAVETRALEQQLRAACSEIEALQAQVRSQPAS